MIGLVLVLLGCYASGITDAEVWARLSVEGVLLGYGATGIHQSKKLRETR